MEEPRALPRSRSERRQHPERADSCLSASSAVANLESSSESRGTRRSSQVLLSARQREFPLPSPLEKPASRSATHTAHTQTPKCRFACLPPSHVPAPGSYTPPCPGSFLVPW